MKAIIYACFLLSGVTGLVYEVLWGKYLALLIGCTSYAHTVVLATFMAGLALGYVVLGRLADRVARLLPFYAWLELGIGVYCACFPWLFDTLTAAYPHLAGALPGSARNMLVKVLLSAVALLPPTFLMGGTLPILSRFVTANLREVGSRIGLLYFINSAGAAIGCLAAGFWMIRAWGMDASMLAAASVNVVIGVLVLGLRHFERPVVARTEAAVNAGDSARSGLHEGQRRAKWLLALVFCTGALSMLYELVWIRLLSLVLGSSAYSFSLMLFTFITGITIGGLIASRLLRRPRDGLLWFGLAELGVFASLLAMSPLYERLPYWFNVLASLLSRTEQAFPLYHFVQVLLCFLVMLAPTTLIGMSLPFAASACVADLSVLGSRVGTVFSLNTLGCVLGAALAGFVAIPALGLQRSMQLGIVLTGLAGGLALLPVVHGRWWMRWAPAVAACVLGTIAAIVAPRWNNLVLNAGSYRTPGLMAHSWKEFSSRWSGNTLRYQKDGPEMSVAVISSPDTLWRWLIVNGKTDASNGPDMGTQVLLAHIPLLLHPSAQSVLIVGLGSGVTAGNVLAHPVRSCDIVEISNEVVAASHFFDDINNRPLEDPRTRLIVSDAKEALLLHPPNSYDVVISEPSNPWVSGIGNLFSQEFYRQVSLHLRTGGVFAQWLHLYEMDDRILAVCLNTMSSVFAHITVWETRTGDIMLLGSATPLVADLHSIVQRLRPDSSQGRLQRALLRDSIPGALEFLSLQVLDNRAFRQTYPGRGRLNTDRFPYLEYEAPRAFFLGTTSNLLSLDERLQAASGSSLELVAYLKDNPLRPADIDGLRALYSSPTRRSSSQRILQSLTWGRFGHADVCVASDSVNAEGARLYLQDGDASLLGHETLWQRRLSSGEMSKEEWSSYMQFENRILYQSCSVYFAPDTSRYNAAQARCLQRFPAMKAELDSSKARLYRLLGLSGGGPGQ